jgi:hypothetical protein
MTSTTPTATITNWKNEDSIYHYRSGLFRDYIEVIADRDATVIDILRRARIREAKCLPKHLAELKIDKLRHNSQVIKQVFYSLRNGMQPMSKLPLPYTIDERRQELIDNLANAYDIAKSRAKCRIVKGHYDKGTSSNDELNFHYIIEIVAAPYKDEFRYVGGHVDFIGMVNNRPSGVDGGAGLFTGNSQDTYSWTDKKYIHRTAANIREILYNCGFDVDLPVLKRKRPCVFMINLICPALDYGGNYGKSLIRISFEDQEFHQSNQVSPHLLRLLHIQGSGDQTHLYGIHCIHEYTTSFHHCYS